LPFAVGRSHGSESGAGAPHSKAAAPHGNQSGGVYGVRPPGAALPFNAPKAVQVLPGRPEATRNRKMPDWPHAPVHRLTEQGAYLVTCGTYLKQHHLFDSERLGLVCEGLLTLAGDFDWRLQAWAVLSNHYHFVAVSPPDPDSLRPMLSKLHGETARRLNAMDGTPGRKVWYQFFDTHITYHRSYLARLKYVHQNPVHHGIVRTARGYPWCSAAWFEREARPAFRKTLEGFKVDRVNVFDPFEVIRPADADWPGSE
jgi:putative transposase